MLNEKKIHEQWILLITFYNQRESFTYSLFDTKKAGYTCTIIFFSSSDDHNTTGSTISKRFSFNKEDKLTNQSLKGYEKDFRPYVLNPKYSCPTSLPLYFYFGYQLLQEKKQMKDCGPVRHHFININ